MPSHRLHRFVHNVLVPQAILAGCIAVYFVFALIIATSIAVAAQ